MHESYSSFHRIHGEEKPASVLVGQFSKAPTEDSNIKNMINMCKILAFREDLQLWLVTSFISF